MTSIKTVTLITLAVLSLNSLFGTEIWVSPEGKDNNPGTQAAPLASPASALRRARELRRLSPSAPGDDIHIILRGGCYKLDQPLCLHPEDSGTTSCLTVLEAAPDEQPIITSGTIIANWNRPAEKIPGLPESAQGRIWVSNTPQFNGRPLEFRQLWINGRKATRARTPNGDTMEQLISWDREKETATLPASLAATSKMPAGAELIVAQQWEIGILRIKTLQTDGQVIHATFQQPESKIEFEHPWPQPILKSEKGSGAFYLANAIEFLDEPGEWFEDLSCGRLYYWPRDDEDMTKAEVVAPGLETLVEIDGALDRPVSNVVFKGIRFAHTTWLRPSFAGHVPLQAGMFITDSYKLRPKGTPDWRGLDNQTWTGRPPAGVRIVAANNIRFERCRFEHMAMSGLDFISGAHDNAVVGCVFSDIGCNGIQLGSFQGNGIETHLPYAPEDEREICARERIANNVITDCANEDWGGVGIIAGYVRDTTIEHNEISNVSYTGISLGWGWTRSPNVMRKNRVHANRFEHIATRLCDDAAIYTLSAQPGTLVDENYIGMIKMSPYVNRPDHWFYLYTDEGSSYITVRDNWSPEEKFLQNANGPGNLWENNGPKVPDKIKSAAGLEPAFRDLSVLQLSSATK